MKILITGGAGFIGSALVRHIIDSTENSVINLDCLTYAGNKESLANCESSERYSFELADICSKKAVQDIFRRHCPDIVMHLAAESHVDRSIDGPTEFMQTNIIGTFNLLEQSQEYFEGLTESAQEMFRFHHVSTDEVYGDLEGMHDLFTEETACAPSSPYSASKAASDHLAVDNLAAICFELGCWLIHISTDYVFDGNSTVPYLELVKTNPQGVYGHTKLDGELAIQSSGCKYLIIRTAWVFSEYGDNFLKTMLRLGTVRDELSIVGDQIGCPTYAQDIAKAIVTMMTQLNEESSASGTFHYCGDQLCSWYEFAGVIFEEARMSGLQTPGLIHSIQSSDYPMAAERPGYSVLDCHKIRNSFGVNTSDWKLGVKNVVSNFHLVKL